MSNYDFFAEAEQLISHAVSVGREADAALLRSAMEEGATGTEILMGLRFHLGELAKRAPFEGEAQLRASRLLSELNRALE